MASRVPGRPPGPHCARDDGQPARWVVVRFQLPPEAKYLFEADTDGDALTDVRFKVVFGAVGADGEQYMTVFRKGRRLGGGRTGGVFDDPFFFDLQAFKDQVKGAGGSRVFCDATPTDFFEGFDLSAIVLQVPTTLLDGPEIGVWGRTRVGSTTLDRAGRPAIATVLITDGLEDAFSSTHPAQDRKQ